MPTIFRAAGLASVLATVTLVVSNIGAAAAFNPYSSGTIGYDYSYVQCGSTAPAAAWLTSVARIVAGMDLSTSPSLLISVVPPLISGRSEVSIGRGLTALRATAARRLVPEVLNRNRFFATELLVRARLAGLRIQQAG